MKVMGIIFANDGHLDGLTEHRTTASVPFGGRYRQVDFALSNLTSAGVRHIGIISRHHYQSLINHIGAGEEWGLELEEGGLEFLTPYAMSATDSYRGKLESLYSAMAFLTYGTEDEYVIMTGSTILCNIDMKDVLTSHIASGKDITIVTKAGIANGQKNLDLAIKLDDNGNVKDIAVDYAAPEGYLATMDLFVTTKKWLAEKVREHIARNRFHMDRDLILGQWLNGEVSINVYQFPGVVLYNESVAEYFQNSLALIDTTTRHDLFGYNHPVYTRVRDRVPTFYDENSNVSDTVLADGCMISGKVSNSVLFRNVTVHSGAEISDCVIMNDAVIGEGAQLQYVILDKDVTVRPGAKLIGTPSNPVIITRGGLV